MEELQKEIENLKKHNGRLQRKNEKLENESCQYHRELIQLRRQNDTLIEAITRMSAMYALMLNKLGCEELNETDYWDTVEDYEDN